MKKSTEKNCPICGKTIKPRGMGGHMALAHGIREKEVIKYVVDTGDDARRNTNDTTKIIPQIEGVKISNEVPEKIIEPSNKIEANIEREDLIENEVRDVPNLYTETDIKILLARIIKYNYQSDQPSQLLREFAKMDMIEDFEKRFKCLFDKVKKANQHIIIGKTQPEHLEFANKYASLKYSL